MVKSWLSIDSIHYDGNYVGYCASTVPLNGNTYQFPRTGNAYILSTFFYPIPNGGRGYFKNRLKQKLIAGKIYCVKFHVNIANTSPRGMDGFGIYFGDNSIDTITKCNFPLSYINPQVKNPIGNVISDTLNWMPITGTFVATGLEKYALIGNFLADASVITSPIYTPYYPQNWTDVCVDDVSCIPLDLPAYAGPDIYGIPTTTVYLGRAQDVGIDEACMWYHLPSTTTAIDTAAGITVTVATTTQTYMVKQDICGVIKYDTVVVYASALGLNDLRFNIEDLRFYPNPTTNELNIEFINVASTSSATELQIEIYNSLGQILREEEITFKENKAIINTKEFANGVYVLSLFDPAKNDKLPTVSKRFVIAR